jgi:predicted kinase
MSPIEAAENWTFPFCPTPPGFHLDWAGLVARFDWLQTLAGCPQDPGYHGEGDVLIHTRLVAEALVSSTAWRELDATARAILFAAALLHDVAKPVCTRQENGRIVSPNHARRGAQIAQEILYRQLPEAGWPVPFALRQQIVGLVRHHGLPLWFWDKAEVQRAVLVASYQARLDHVTLLAQADVDGRIASDLPDLHSRLALFREYVQEQGCWQQPYPFASDHGRFIYFTNSSTHPDYVPYDDTTCEVSLLSGLPGAGKDTWLARMPLPQPVISLDDLRAEMDVRPGDNQGRVTAAARQQARTYLRQGQDFIWNATNVTQPLRRRLISLFTGYKARVRIVYRETSWPELLRRNRERPQPIPESVLTTLLPKLNVPDKTEARQVEWVIEE